MLFVGGAQAYLGGPPVANIGMNDQVQLFLSVEAPMEMMESGDSLPLTVVVVDQHDEPVEGALIVASVEGDATVSPSEARTDAQGRAAFEFTSSIDGESAFSIRFEADYPGGVRDEEVFEVVVFTLPEPAPVPNDVQIITVGLGVLGLAALAGSEVGRYGIFKSMVFPLYTRLKREEVLDHFVRGQIYGYILSNPGEHYTGIRDHLKVNNGTLSHHLRTLEVQGFIRSMRDGSRKRFYPISMVMQRERGIRLSDLQLKILDRVEDGDGPTQSVIAEAVDSTQQSVSYNLRAMVREEVIRVEREGRQKRYYPASETFAAGPPPMSG
jgi:DNA-binding MarR family transcriptional regulator